MKEQLDNALLQIITDAASVRDFVLAQAPDVVIQLLRWKFTVSLLSCLFGIGLLFSLRYSVKVFKAHLPHVSSTEWNRHDASCAFVVIWVLAVVLLGPCFLVWTGFRSGLLRKFFSWNTPPVWYLNPQP